MTASAMVCKANPKQGSPCKCNGNAAFHATASHTPNKIKPMSLPILAPAARRLPMAAQTVTAATAAANTSKAGPCNIGQPLSPAATTANDTAPFNSLTSRHTPVESAQNPSLHTHCFDGVHSAAPLQSKHCVVLQVPPVALGQALRSIVGRHTMLPSVWVPSAQTHIPSTQDEAPKPTGQPAVMHCTCVNLSFQFADFASNGGKSTTVSRSRESDRQTPAESAEYPSLQIHSPFSHVAGPRKAKHPKWAHVPRVLRE
mmetsp:Transcript_13963/g.30895  ORF Transcript_13963/g.30895 Transcript_13963/m.30895 type:complete len:257 (+) Transcript_13963:351-1121(+)